MSEKKDQVVFTKSKAYGYSYASLGDIANQGFEIPRMKTGTENEREYVYCYDKETKEWIRGAEIVIPQMKGMNTAQMYGSALTFSRRYSVMMFLGLVSDDDKQLETKAPMEEKTAIQKNGQAQNSAMWQGLQEDLNIKDLADEFRKLYTQEEQDRILKGLKYTRAEDIGIVDLQKYVNFKKYGKK